MLGLLSVRQYLAHELTTGLVVRQHIEHELTSDVGLVVRLHLGYALTGVVLILWSDNTWGTNSQQLC